MVHGVQEENDIIPRVNSLVEVHVVLTLERLSMMSERVIIQMKATEQVLFIMPYKVILTFESVDEILKSF